MQLRSSLPKSFVCGQLGILIKARGRGPARYHVDESLTKLKNKANFLSVTLTLPSVYQECAYLASA